MERLIECVNAVCGTIESGERPACINPVENPLCDDNNLDRLREASQARFRTEPGCQSGANGALWWVGCVFVCVILMRSRREVYGWR